MSDASPPGAASRPRAAGHYVSTEPFDPHDIEALTDEQEPEVGAAEDAAQRAHRAVPAVAAPGRGSLTAHRRCRRAGGTV